MKTNAKNNARLAVTAGLCASLTLGGLPLAAIAAETVSTAQDTVAAATVEGEAEQGTAEEAGTPAEGASTPADAVPAQAPEAAAAKAAAAPASLDAPKTAPFQGEGTAENPYLVGSADDLTALAQKVAGGDTALAAAHYRLTADINLENVAWTPIGTAATPFTGTFVGTGHTISNLSVDMPEGAYAGLFGLVKSPAKLEGITVENATVNAQACAGVIAGSAFTGAAANCTVKGAISVTAHYKVGGMFGEGYAKLDNCHVSATGTVTGVWKGNDFEGDNVGGLIGFRGEGNVITTNCSVSGISVAGTRKVGGIVGSAFTDNKYEGCSVSNVSVACNASKSYGGSIINKCTMAIGGIVGLYTTSGANDGTLKDCAVSDVSLSVTDPELAAKNVVVMGYVAGGQRGGLFGNVVAPADTIDIAGNQVFGNNSGANTDQKFPGNTDMSGEQPAVAVIGTNGLAVGAYATFKEAAAAATSGQTIKLQKDVEFADNLDIKVPVNIDLNGCTLTGTHNTFSIRLMGKGTSCIFDSSADKSGKLVNTSASSRALVIDGSGVEVVLDGITAESAFYVAQVSSSAKVTVKGGSYTGGNTVFAMYGTKSEADKDKPTTIVVEGDAKLTANTDYVISTNGSAKYLGPVDVQINGGTLLSKGATGGAVYLPAHGSFTMTDGHVEGAQGVQICDAVAVNISGGTIKATKPDTVSKPSKAGDGIVEDGAALSIVSRGGGYGNPGTATVAITGGTFEAAANPAIREYGIGGIEESLVKDMSIGGENLVVISHAADGSAIELALLEGDDAKVVSGGTFNKELPEGYLAEGAGQLEQDENGNFVVHKHVWSDEFSSDAHGHWHACTVCGEKADEAEHAGGEWVSNSTDHWKVCAECSTPFAIASHEFGAWKVTKEATATEPGARQRACKVCGKVVSEAMPALGGKPGTSGDKLAQTGDASMIGVVTTGVIGALAAVSGVATSRKRRNN